MKIKLYKNSVEMGKAAAKAAAEKLGEVIEKKGYARILLSTGASQFDFFTALADEKVEWSKVEMFHLDEYVGISPDHPASFNKYLRERFVEVNHPAKYHLMNGERDPEETIKEVSALISEAKSQGSEFPVVVMPVAGGPPMLLTRNLFYTALTRARTMVVLVGREDVVRLMVENDHVLSRYTTLAERLRAVSAMAPQSMLI